MKVYILKFQYHMGGFRGGYDHHEILGIYASEDSVKKELDKRKEKFLAEGNGFKVQDHENGCGFVGYHEMGSMSFIPGNWSYEEHEVKE